MKGIEFRNYGNRIMKKIFEGTPLQALEPLLIENTCMFFGKNFETLHTILMESNKLSWVEPLGKLHIIFFVWF